MTTAAPTAATPSGSPSSAVVLLGLLAVFWGLNWPVMKIGLSEVPPFVFRTAASLAGAAGLFAIARIQGLALGVAPGQRKGLVVAALLNMTLWNILAAYGITLMNSGRAAILAYTMPLWATLIGTVVLRERLNWRGGVALLLGLLGMALLFMADAGAGVTGQGVLGPLLVVLAALAWGAGTVAVKYYRFDLPITVLTAWQHLLGVVPVAFVALLWDVHNITQITLWPALCVVYNMTVTAVFCYWAFFTVVSRLPVVVSTVGTLLVPVLGVFFSALIFAEPPTLADYVALCLVVAAVFLVLTHR